MSSSEIKFSNAGYMINVTKKIVAPFPSLTVRRPTRPHRTRDEEALEEYQEGITKWNNAYANRVKDMCVQLKMEEGDEILWGVNLSNLKVAFPKSDFTYVK